MNITNHHPIPVEITKSLATAVCSECWVRAYYIPRMSSKVTEFHPNIN